MALACSLLTHRVNHERAPPAFRKLAGIGAASFFMLGKPCGEAEFPAAAAT